MNDFYLKGKERDEYAAFLRKQGKPFREIGEILGVSTERARQLVQRRVFHEKYGRGPRWDDWELSARTFHVLSREGVQSKEEARLFLERIKRDWKNAPGSSTQWPLDAGRKPGYLKNFGRKSMRELCQFITRHYAGKMVGQK